MKDQLIIYFTKKGDAADERSRKHKFRALVARDTLLVFLGVQVAIVLLGLLVMGCDQPKENIRKLFPDLISEVMCHVFCCSASHLPNSLSLLYY